MQDQKKFVKLADLQSFKVVKFVKMYWQMYDTASNTFKKEDTYFEGAKSSYLFEMEEGMLNLSSSQLGQMLVSLFESKMPIERQIFNVKTNGQTGKEIRYYINLDYKHLNAQLGSARPTTPEYTQNTPQVQNEISVDEIPF